MDQQQQRQQEKFVLCFTQKQVDHMKRIYQKDENIFLGDLDLYLHLGNETKGDSNE